MARVMGERMRLALGQPILIENVVGAGACRPRTVLAR
jgi:tripartite-type tricarboxylate transporter receptor subunit TctC